MPHSRLRSPLTAFCFVLCIALTLTACSSAARTQSGAAAGGKLSPMSELIVGTLKLDGTPNVVTKEQAAQLLPMWQVYQQLIASDSAAQAEIDGLSQQIRDTMTADQRKAISDLKLSQSDMFTFMQQQGVGMGGSSQGSRTTTTQRNNNFPGGGDPGDMPPGAMGDPGGFPGGGMPSGSSTRSGAGTQTPNSTPATSMRAGGTDRVPAALITTLIQYLQKAAAPAATPQP